ncbi:lipopolysaccharide biosynthesis protein [Priestia megaterium]|uniref:lipopolysaccharide biosynthesis protein n=1 Tax=Priestia megaterium TaxID=1404 RepID=UPI0031FD3952
MRSSKALKNLISNLFLQITTAAVGFVITNYFILTYGSEMNGLLSSIRQFINFILIVEAGISAASVFALFSPLAEKNEKKINAVLSATNILYFRSGYIFGILLLILSVLYSLFTNSTSQFITFALVIILGANGVTEFFLVGKYRVLLTADQKSYVVSIVQAIATLLAALISVILMKLGFNVIFVQAAYTIVYLSRSLIIYYYVKKKYSLINHKVQPEMLALENKKDVLIHQIAGLVVNSTPIVILTIFTNFKEVSVYTIYQMVIYAVYLIINSFKNGLMASFGEIIAKGDTKTLLKSYNTFESFYYIVLSWAYTCASILILPFISIYTHEVEDVDYIRPTIAVLFIIVGVCNNIRVPQMTLVTAAGHYKETRYRALLEALINIIVSLTLVNHFGIIGVLLGSVCSFAYRTTDFIIYASKNILKQSPIKTIKRLLANIILSIIPITVFIFIFPLQVNNMVDWILYALIVGIVTLVTFILGNFVVDSSTMKEIISRIKIVRNHLVKR